MPTLRATVLEIIVPSYNDDTQIQLICYWLLSEGNSLEFRVTRDRVNQRVSAVHISLSPSAVLLHCYTVTRLHAPMYCYTPACSHLLLEPAITATR
jgi:hypothetical protein